MRLLTAFVFLLYPSMYRCLWLGGKSGEMHGNNEQKMVKESHWERNATKEAELGITDVHRISEEHIHVPKLFILGAQKCATLSLYNLFESLHPNICNRAIKEPGYFGSMLPAKWGGGVQKYEALFRYNETCQNLVGKIDVKARTHNLEATPRYFDAMYVTPRLFYSYARELHPSLRFIVILREPVSRDFGWYNHNARFCARSIHHYILNHKLTAGKVMAGKAVWNTTELCQQRQWCKPSCRSHASRAVLGREVEALATFAEAYKAGETDRIIGDYAFHLKRWFSYFNRDQFFIVNWETLITNTTDTVERMTSFLGLPPFPKEAYTNGKIVLPQTKVAHMNTTLDCGTQQVMHIYYEQHNQKLYSLLAQTRKLDSLEPIFPDFRSSPCV